MAIRWVLHGELNDPHDEFFTGVQPNTGTGATKLPITNIWRDSYFLRPSMLPSFLSLTLAQKILIIGKSINFIKVCVPKLSKEPGEGGVGRSASLNKRGGRRDLTVASEQMVNDNASVVNAAVAGTGKTPTQIS